MEQLLKLLNSISPLTEKDREIIIENTYLEKVKKGNWYLEKDNVCKKMGFVQNGIIRVVRMNSKDEEFTQYFISEGHFAVDIESFTNKTPSLEYLETLTDCEFIVLTNEKIELFERQIVNFTKILSQLKEKALLEKYNLKSEMLTDNAQTKYQKLMQRQPTIIQRVSQNHIASFLGITQYTLSRIRGKK
jgi:CRP/FNR family transcriptional regulator, anaerobic regulatory protein